ncbi:hypothetical protein AB0M46_50910 [Dactylosporangium sp. NPDC051485]|uniref:hypothetical protein n=1 Tax=Dactylosporangium sp. NPDC051485 TaxID=3154846 RepID=UPI003420DE81
MRGTRPGRDRVEVVDEDDVTLLRDQHQAGALSGPAQPGVRGRAGHVDVVAQRGEEPGEDLGVDVVGVAVPAAGDQGRGVADQAGQGQGGRGHDPGRALQAGADDQLPPHRVQRRPVPRVFGQPGAQHRHADHAGGQAEAGVQAGQVDAQRVRAGDQCGERGVDARERRGRPPLVIGAGSVGVVVGVGVGVGVGPVRVGRSATGHGAGRAVDRRTACDRGAVRVTSRVTGGVIGAGVGVRAVRGAVQDGGHGHVTSSYDN